jgi:phosphatidylglycerol:prolipoprotein diacylglycerol transferase
LDLAALGLVCAQIVGRWGNYFNQEIFGKPTSLPWGIPIDPAFRSAEYFDAQYFHPTVLYESLGSVVLLGILLLIFLKNVAGKKVVGIVFAAYLMGYSIMRFLLEFLRTDYSPIVFGARWAQIISVVLFLAGATLLIRKIMWSRRG